MQPRKIGRRTAQTLALLLIVSTPAAASHDTVGCTPPESLMPLMNLLHSLGELAFIAGISIGTIGFIVSGICFMIPGEDWTRRGKNVAKNVFVGTVLLLSANMIVGYLIAQTGGTICG